MSCGQTQRGFRQDCETRLLLNTQHAYVLYTYHILNFFFFSITIRNTIWMFVPIKSHFYAIVDCQYASA